MEDFDSDLIIQLQTLSEKHDFLIFEDRKFADIGVFYRHRSCSIVSLTQNFRQYRNPSVLSWCPQNLILGTPYKRARSSRPWGRCWSQIHRPSYRSWSSPLSGNVLGRESRNRRIYFCDSRDGPSEQRFRGRFHRDEPG